MATNLLILSELLRINAPAEGESPFNNDLVLRGLGTTWFESIAYRDGVIGMHAPQLAKTPGSCFRSERNNA